jgi:hypothetical protein
MFLLFWGFKGETLQQLLVNPEAERTLQEGKEYLQRAIEQGSIEVKALLRFLPATRRGNDIVLAAGRVLADSVGEKSPTVLPMLRSQSSTGHFLCLSDFFDEQQPSPLGLFTIVTRPKHQPAGESDCAPNSHLQVGERLMSHAICARLTEACAEWLQQTHLSPLTSHLSPLNKDAVVSFNVGNIHHLDMGTLLDRLGIAVRTGHHCAQPLMDRLGISGTVRASFALYNTKEEIDTLVAGIRRVSQMF